MTEHHDGSDRRVAQTDRRLTQTDRRSVSRGGRRLRDRREGERVWRAHQMSTYLEQQKPRE